VARSLVESPLVKTMVYGGDPNVGRILMAIGKCVDCRIEAARIRASVGEVVVVEGGLKAAFDEGTVRSLLHSDPVDLLVDLGMGPGEARAWGCDLGHGYVDENAAYYST
jgi:glutamate N-acetyltransferase/amino-acid N-acetyltransferase